MTAEPIQLFWWRLEYPAPRNFGDEISAPLIQEIFGQQCSWAAPDRCQLAAAGSIVEMVIALKGGNRPVLWGSGFMKDGDDDLAEHDFHIVALRGTRSRDRVRDGRDTVVLGDPGLLASALLPAAPATKWAVGVLPHFLDAAVPEIDWLRAQDGVHIIDATDDPRRVVDQVAQCRCVLSSSLHGLIIADSVGIPNAHLKLSSNQLIGGMHKFRDYYSVFADPTRHFAIPVPAVLSEGVEAIAARVEDRYRVPADIGQIKNDLIKSFPF